MATNTTEKAHDGEFLLSEANGHQSRERKTVISGQNLVAGTVVGVITASGKVTILAPAAGDGSQNAAGVLLNGVNASAADAAGVIIARNAEVISAALTWPGGITAPQKATATTALAALGILIR